MNICTTILVMKMIGCMARIILQKLPPPPPAPPTASGKLDGFGGKGALIYNDGDDDSDNGPPIVVNGSSLLHIDNFLYFDFEYFSNYYFDNSYDVFDTGIDYSVPPLPEGTFADLDSAESSAIEAIKAAIENDGIKNQSEDQTEYGISIYKNADGTYTLGQIIQGQSYAQSNTPATSVTLDIGRAYAEIVSVIHSHPFSSIGTTNEDNQGLSRADRSAMRSLVDRGADANELSFTIIDTLGNVFEYNYQ